MAVHNLTIYTEYLYPLRMCQVNTGMGLRLSPKVQTEPAVNLMPPSIGWNSGGTRGQQTVVKPEEEIWEKILASINPFLRKPVGKARNGRQWWWCN